MLNIYLTFVFLMCVIINISGNIGIAYEQLNTSTLFQKLKRLFLIMYLLISTILLGLGVLPSIIEKFVYLVVYILGSMAMLIVFDKNEKLSDYKGNRPFIFAGCFIMGIMNFTALIIYLVQIFHPSFR